MDTKMMKDTDHLLREDVVAELAWSPDVNDAHVGVSVRNGAVTLSGEVDSHSERHAAVRAAMRVAGVTVVADELDLASDLDAQHADAEIAARIREILTCSAKVPGDAIKVSVRDHVAILTGQVTYQFQRREAAELVGGVVGVRRVHNRIQLSPRASAEDTQEHIRSALARDAATDADAITVTAVGTEVTLTGNVRTWLERSEAARAAWSSPHVTTVHNQLEVHP